MKFPPLPLLVLDTETTGFVPGIHRVIEYACVRIRDGKIVEEYEQLISAEGDEIPPYVQVMTHIRPQDLEGQPTFGDIFEKIERMVTPDTIIVGQNVKFDVAMLRGEGWDLSDAQAIDTAMLASLVFPELKSYSLGYVSAALGLDHTPKHRALGDVRATTALFSKCWERLASLPAEDRSALAELSKRGSEGYRRLFGELVSLPARPQSRPDWLAAKKSSPSALVPSPPLALPQPQTGTVQLCEEPLHPQFLVSVIPGSDARTWIAVKNLDATLRRLPPGGEFTVLPSPDSFLSGEARERFLAQPQFTADELTLACKLHLYAPHLKSDLPLHGEEYQAWTAKLACTAESTEYLERRNLAVNGPVLVNHHELLLLLRSPSPVIPSDAHIIVDDASMLEDTATQAFGWTCFLATLRAAAQGETLLTKCTDLIELWVEKTRSGLDLKYLTEADLQTTEAGQIRRLIGEVLSTKLLPAPRRALEDLLRILDAANLPGRIVWIESFIDGSKSVRSVPEDVRVLLSEILYHRFPVTLLIPQHSAEWLTPILSGDERSAVLPPVSFPFANVTLRMPLDVTIDGILGSPEGKTMLLVSSKRTIEDLYVKHFEQCETAGITLLCQGFSGGQSRMQAEFALADSPAILVATPWMYETMELPPATLDRLVMQVLPFDHPSHAVFSKRGQRYRNPFNDYTLPRLKHRLFRLMRTFCRHAKDGGVVDVLDDRLRTKLYGKEVARYLESILPSGNEGRPKPSGEQLRLV